MKIIRYGILGTAGIARKNWRAIHDTGNAVVAAVASRDVERSRQFIAECQNDAPFDKAPAAFGSYEALLQSPDVDAVYIPLPTGLRKEWVLRAAAAGKHVVCEKPCGLNTTDVREMLDACRKSRVQFMDGVMFMHNPRLDRIRQALDDGKSIGNINRITSMFSFLGSGNFFTDNIRLHSELEPAGCLGDLGWYSIRFSLWAMNWRMPREVSGRILSRHAAGNSPGLVPTDFSGELIFDDRTSAAFSCSFLVEKQQWLHVSGDKGSLSFPDFVHPDSIHEPSFQLNGSEVRVKCCDCKGPHTDSRRWAQDVNLFRNFAVQIQSGGLNEDWPMQALKTQQVVDACLASAQERCELVPVSAA
ncbi:MAG TPA: Gfo/Idh/MocA family oxidoreductase [Verrucomicrobiota bacterium]|nr:Gfo/Idh/MocA family oxidoreductase [Verrucomicrobiota bacterium]